MVEVKVNWRCNVVHAGPAGGGGGLVRQAQLLSGPHPAAGLLPPFECLWPRGRSGQGGGPRGADTTPHTGPAPGDTRPSPRPRSRRSRAGSTSTSTSPSMCFGPLWSVAWSCPASAPGKWWADPPLRVPLAREGRQTSTYNLAMAGAGHQVGAAQGGRHRVLYALFPQVDWNFVFVDGFLWLLRSEGAVNLAVALLATLLALGTPLSM